MFVRREVSKEELMIEVQDDLPCECSEVFQKEIDEVLETDYPLVTLNLKVVKDLSASCMGRIVMFRRSLYRRKRTFRIKGCSEALYIIFKLLELDKSMEIEK